VSRKSGREGGRWLHPKGANIIAMLGLGFRNALVDGRWANSLLLSSHDWVSPLTW